MLIDIYGWVDSGWVAKLSSPYKNNMKNLLFPRSNIYILQQPSYNMWCLGIIETCLIHILYNVLIRQRMLLRINIQYLIQMGCLLYIVKCITFSRDTVKWHSFKFLKSKYAKFIARTVWLRNKNTSSFYACKFYNRRQWFFFEYRLSFLI